MTFRHETQSAAGTWIVVADQGHARIFSQRSDGTEELDKIKVMHCPEARILPHDQVTDQPGYFKGHSGSMNTGDLKTDFKHRTAQRFAHEIVETLEEGRETGKFAHLILVAAPMFLGVLKASLHEPLARTVISSIDKGYASLSPDEIAARLKTNC